MNLQLDDTISVVPYSESEKEVWNDVLAKSKAPIFLFNRNYMDYHSDRFSDASLLIYRKKKPIGIFPCNSAGDTITSHGGLTYGGLIFSLDVHVSEVLEIFRKIGEYFFHLGVRKIIYKSIPYAFSSYPSGEDLYALYRMRAKIIRRDFSSIIDMKKRPKLSDSRKNTIKKASKAGVQIREMEDYAAFHELLVEALSKFNVKPVHSLKEIQHLAFNFKDVIKCFGAYLDDKLISAVLIYDFGSVVHTQYMCSSTDGRQLGALDAILLYLIEDIYSEKEYFSFGASTEENGNVLNDGLARQKEGFGARGIVLDHYEWELI
ncbi:GNAT family N-acetyltransferase [Aeromonas rivipollensis]|uniref:GNAT family N-acetyltransferase n=1 Tax=Aeromonas rivipollensis TaxID=948519 RepID=UPI0038F0D89E